MLNVQASRPENILVAGTEMANPSHLYLPVQNKNGVTEKQIFRDDSHVCRQYRTQSGVMGYHNTVCNERAK